MASPWATRSKNVACTVGRDSVNFCRCLAGGGDGAVLPGRQQAPGLGMLGVEHGQLVPETVPHQPGVQLFWS